MQHDRQLYRTDIQTYHSRPQKQELSLQPITSPDDIADGLVALRQIDPRLSPVINTAGEIPLRRRPADFAGLAQIVTGQLLSVASAAAIFKRLEACVFPLDADTFSRMSDQDLDGVGLSNAKIRTLRAVAAACDDGLDLTRLAQRPASEAHSRLCSIKGIGPWSADIFLLFCAGHPDIFPSGDLALRIAVGNAFDLEDRPSIKELDGIAQAWAPWRAVAARVFWSWYKVQKQGRETIPL